MSEVTQAHDDRLARAVQVLGSGLIDRAVADWLQDQLVEMWQEAHDRKDAPKWWFLEGQLNARGAVR